MVSEINRAHQLKHILQLMFLIVNTDEDAARENKQYVLRRQVGAAPQMERPTEDPVCSVRYIQASNSALGIMASSC